MIQFNSIWLRSPPYTNETKKNISSNAHEKKAMYRKKVFGVIFTLKLLIKMNHSLIVLNVMKAFSLSLNYIEK